MRQVTAPRWLVVTVAVISSPILFPVISLFVLAETWFRGLCVPTPRRRGWEHLWAVYGSYLGLFAIAHLLQRRCAPTSAPSEHDPDNWFAEIEDDQ